MTKIDLLFDPKSIYSYVYFRKLRESGLLGKVVIFDFAAKNRYRKFLQKLLGARIECSLSSIVYSFYLLGTCDIKILYKLIGLVKLGQYALDIIFINLFVREHVYKCENFEHLAKILPKSMKSDNLILYTDGGRVPSSLLNSLGGNLLHVHPGFVPDRRGSDCLLWSIYTHSRFEYSLFFMSEGIDTGSYLHRKTIYPDIRNRFGSTKSTYAVYKAILFGIDADQRISTLLEFISSIPNGTNWKSIATDQDVHGTTYYYMSKKLKLAAIEKLLKYV